MTNQWVGAGLWRRSALWLGLVLGIVAATSAWAGGFWIELEAPSAWKDSRIKDAVLVVRSYVCGERSASKISAIAEGVVDGKRRTIRLTPSIAADGIYAIRHEWPDRGSWVVAVQADYNGMVCSKLVAVPSSGVMPASQQTCLCPKCFPWRMQEGSHLSFEHKLSVKTFSRALTAPDVEFLLKSVTAGEASVNGGKQAETSAAKVVEVSGKRAGK